MTTAAADRVDIFTLIHKGIRRTLFDTALLRRPDRLRPGRGHRHGRRRRWLAASNSCGSTLNTRIGTSSPSWCVWRRGSPPRWGPSTSSWRRRPSPSRRCSRRLAAAPAGERPAMGREMFRRMTLLVADQLRHLEREEREGNATLWAYLPDAEIVALRARLQAELRLPRSWRLAVNFVGRLLRTGERPGHTGGQRDGAAVGFLSGRRLGGGLARRALPLPREAHAHPTLRRPFAQHRHQHRREESRQHDKWNDPGQMADPRFGMSVRASGSSADRPACPACRGWRRGPRPAPSGSISSVLSPRPREMRRRSRSMDRMVISLVSPTLAASRAWRRCSAGAAVLAAPASCPMCSSPSMPGASSTNAPNVSSRTILPVTLLPTGKRAGHLVPGILRPATSATARCDRAGGDRRCAPCAAPAPAAAARPPAPRPDARRG